MTMIPETEIVTQAVAELKLIRLVDKYYADPLGFVRAMFPWGEPG
jgi:hypothetical protein